MKSNEPCVLTVNGGSSSIKFALFEARERLTSILRGEIRGVGAAKGSMTVKEAGNVTTHVDVAVPDQAAATGRLMDWLQKQTGSIELSAVGHRVVHGGSKYWEPIRIKPEVIEDLRRFSPFDPEHLPGEILLMEAFQNRFPNLSQVACFDTAFHHDLPRVAKLLAIPRRYEAKGIRRYGFHGLSCTYLMQELARQAGVERAKGRVILAHLGSGASITAVRAGSSIDTSMALTPAAGLPMSSRSGDLDPGLPSYLAQTDHLDAKAFHRMINFESGLLGISEISSDLQELLSLESQDVRAAEAVAVFSYQAKKFIGAYSAALGGLDDLIFSGGIGEHAAIIRQRICEGLGFIGIEIDESRNAAHAKVVSTDSSRVVVRVIRTDEEIIMAQSVGQVLGLAIKK